MRVVVVAVALLCLATTAAVAEPTNVHEGSGGGAIEYSGSDPGGAPGGGASGSGGYYSEHPYLSTDQDGNTCVATRYERHDTAEEAAAAQREEDNSVSHNLYYAYRACPSQSAPEGSSAADAQAFWGQVPLPKPAPYIAPGWAVTGRRAYLETRSEPAGTYSRTTPRGELVINATGPYYVDWGDGTQSGPYEASGSAWPNGTITHVYEDVGTYDVVVTQRWSATWHMSNGESGRLGGLRTEGRIEDFWVEQLQAVRNR